MYPQPRGGPALVKESSLKDPDGTLDFQFTTKVDAKIDRLECHAFCDLKGAEYAFYLNLDGKTVSKKWYRDEPMCSFNLEYGRTKTHSVVFFVKDLDGNIHQKTTTIQPLEIDFIPSCAIVNETIRCNIETTQKNTEYAFYLYFNDEEVRQIWYSSEKSVEFSIGDVPITRFEVKYFVRDRNSNIFSKRISFELYQPRVNTDRTRNNFNFFRSFDGRSIYKKTGGENKRFKNKLLEHGGIESFREMLNHDSFSGKINKHIVKGFELENDGSYKSEYIHGYRLDLLAAMMDEYPSLNLPLMEERKNIKTQCEKLLVALREADSNRELTGDWALHNLIYSPTKNCIFNIDLEGFITYKPLPEWANLRHISNWIEELLTRL